MISTWRASRWAKSPSRCTPGSCLVDPQIGAAGDVDRRGAAQDRVRQDRADLEFAPRHLRLRPAHRGAWQPRPARRRKPARHHRHAATARRATRAIRPCRSSSNYAEAYRRELDTFVASVLDGAPVAPSGEDGLKAQLLADAATQAAPAASRCASDMSDITERFALAVAVAREAGEVARKAYEQPATARTFKGPQDYVLESDAQVERVIRERVLAAFPNDSFFGEEGGGAFGRDVWVVDRSTGFRPPHPALVHLDRVRARHEDRGRRDLPAADRRDVCGPAAGGATLNGKTMKASGSPTSARP